MINSKMIWIGAGIVVVAAGWIYNSQKMVDNVDKATASSGITTAGNQPVQSLNQYANMCRTAIKKIESFNCLDGVIIPVTINGGETPAYKDYKMNMDCDRPALLPFMKGNEGQCIPGSRLINQSDGLNQVAILCSRQAIRPLDSVYFDLIAIVSHNVSTGDTCWFASQGSEVTPEGIDASNVPSPGGEKGDPSSHEKATAFWTPPSDIGNLKPKDRCGYCHDNDPFMYSPYMGQVWDKMPVNPLGLYDNIGEDFKIWEENVSLSTAGNTCVGCHRLGVQFTSENGLKQSVGLLKMDNTDEWAETYPQTHWNPVGNFHSLAQWDVIYKKDAHAMLKCHKLYSTLQAAEGKEAYGPAKKAFAKAGCIAKPIPK